MNKFEDFLQRYRDLAVYQQKPPSFPKLTASEAIQFTMEAYERGYSFEGFEGFNRIGSDIRPNQDLSIDRADFDHVDDFVERAIQILISKIGDSNVLFEVVLSSS